MNKNLSLSLTGAALLAPVAQTMAQTKQVQQKKPMNIVYIMSDDHSYQTISAYDKRFIYQQLSGQLA